MYTADHDLLGAVLETTGALVVVLDSDGRIVRFNPACEALTGYAVGEVTGRCVWDLFLPPEETTAVRAVFDRLRTGDFPFQHENDWVTRTGERRRILWSNTAIPGADGEVSFVVTTGLDVTELRRTESALRASERRLAVEEALRRSEARFSGIISTVADAIVTTDDELRITSFNAGAEEIFGYAAAELLGRPLDLLLPERFRARHAEHVRRFADSPAPSRFMGRRGGVYGLRSDGTEFPAEISVAKLELDEERVFAAVLRDVTDQVAAAEALRRSEARLAEAQRIAHIGNWEWDILTDGLVWSDEIYRIFGLEPQQFGASYTAFLSCIHPEDRQRVIDTVDRAVREGAPYGIDHRIVLPDGTVRIVHEQGEVDRDEAGRPARMVGTVQDVTESRSAEESLRLLAAAGERLAGSLDREDTLESVFGLIVPALADWCVVDVVGRDGRLCAIRIAAADPWKEALLREMLERHPHDLRCGAVARVLSTGEPLAIASVGDPELEAMVQGPEHLEVLRRLEPRSTMIVPLRARGRVLGAIVFTASESGRRYGPRELVLAEQLAHRTALALDNAQLYEDARQAIAARDHVLGVVSHDLRNPLNIVYMATQILLQQCPAEERSEASRRQVETIWRAADQMNRLIQDLLDIGRMEAGELGISPQPEPAAQLVADALESFGPLAEEHGVRLDGELDEALPPVRVDRNRVLQVFSNLIGNAVKFTPAGGRIVVRGSRGAGDVLFSVSDTGPGIPADHVPRVFDRYWQAKKGKGTGLGLFIARGIVEAHGGRIWVESEAGSGATLRFTLPAARSDG